MNILLIARQALFNLATIQQTSTKNHSISPLSMNKNEKLRLINVQEF